MGYVLSSFGLSSEQNVYSFSRYVRITSLFTINLLSKIISEYDEAK